MKYALCLLLTLVGITASAAQTATFCRQVPAIGFGQPQSSPPAMRSHCVRFSGGYMTDNANTFFGNPPETLKYKIQGADVMVLQQGVWEVAYTFNAQDDLTNEVGAILKRK